MSGLAGLRRFFLHQKQNLIFALALILQNALIFGQHYAGQVGFPWDFPVSYFPWVAYWTASIGKGIFPQWMPYQSMGYPFILQLQASLFYPPFWLFPLLQIPHTYQAAVISQCLHVLAGALGCYLLLKTLFKQPAYALIGAVAFQFFGGFYSNAEHSDVIRSFALMPWMLWSFTFYTETAWGRLKRWQLPDRVLAAPLVVMFYATGAYPGSFLAACFLIACYVGAQLAMSGLQKSPFQRLAGQAGILATLAALGVMMAFVHLGPSWTFRAEFSRLNEFPQLERNNIVVADLPGLFLSNTTLPGEVSMNSLYITLPMLLLAFCLPLAAIKKHAPLVGLLVFASLMAAGSQSFFYNAITRLISPLALSRFPSGDYRAWVSLALIALAMPGLDALLFRRVGWKSLLARLAVAVAFFGWGVAQVYVKPPFFLLNKADPGSGLNALLAWTGLGVHPRYVAACVALFLIALIALFLCWRWGQPGIPHWKIALLVAVICLDGGLVISDMYTWRSVVEYPHLFTPKGGLLHEFTAGEFSSAAIFDHFPAQRPARQVGDDPEDLRWQGYINGNYMMSDYKTCPTHSCGVIEKSPVLRNYMKRAWQPVLLPVAQLPAQQMADIPRAGVAQLEESVFNAPAAGAISGVQQVRYEPSRIVYEVNLPADTLMIENELYFPGWSGEIIHADGTRAALQPVKVNDALRGWVFPAGRYTFQASFVFPGFSTYVAISLGALLVWLAGMVLIKNRHTAQEAQQ